MKSIYIGIALLAIANQVAYADGYPFDPSTQQVTCDTLRVRLSEPQIESLSATGLVTLNDSQLSLVRRFYPNAIHVQSVISATFNDNHEGLTTEEVPLFWVAAAEIAITLNPTVIASEELRRSALTEEAAPPSSDIRIAPNGQVYLAGKRASMKDAIELITARGKHPNDRHVTICVAPPFHSPLSTHQDPDGHFQDTKTLERSVAEIFQTLAMHGESQDITVHKGW